MTSRAWLRCSGLALLLLAGCYKATFYQNPSAVAGARHERWSDFFIYGLVGSEHFDVRDFCGQDAVAEIRTGANFATGLVSLVTIGIYTPHKVYITCAAKPGQILSSTLQLQLLADGEGRLAQATVRRGDRALTSRIEQADARTFRVSYAEVSP
jgi:hypothetical protein